MSIMDTMNLNCAVLHNEESVLRQMEGYINKFPFLTLCGCYESPIDALKAYYDQRVDVYFIGLYSAKKDLVDGMDFARLLASSTRVIFLADTDQYASACFRLDALDYFSGEISFSVFSQAVFKSVRWFTGQDKKAKFSIRGTKENALPVICVRANSKILFLELSKIYCVEGCGDYVKVFCTDMDRAVLTLCSMKYMESKLPKVDFIRVHRSFIIQKRYIRAVGNNNIQLVNGREIPVGDAYRKQLNDYLSCQMC